MWADIDTNKDFLNYSEVADLAIDVIRNPLMRPVSMGVFGTWGTGKSVLLNPIEDSLKQAAGKRFVVIRFDAWLYQGFDDARAALMEVIAAPSTCWIEVAMAGDTDGVPVVTPRRRRR